jgi:hypothetical protein
MRDRLADLQPALRCLTLAQLATRATEACVAVPEPVHRAADETKAASPSCGWTSVG